MTASTPPVAASCADAFPIIDRSDLQSLGNLARRYLGCDHLAQDALQEALLALSQESEVPERPVGWLTRAVIYRCRHLRRSLRRRKAHEHRASLHCELHDNCDNPLHSAVAHEVGEMLDAVRDTLPSQQRAALDLFESDGQDYQAIATVMGVPIGTVRSRLARARHALRSALHGAAANSQP